MMRKSAWGVLAAMVGLVLVTFAVLYLFLLNPLFNALLVVLIVAGGASIALGFLVLVHRGILKLRKREREKASFQRLGVYWCVLFAIVFALLWHATGPYYPIGDRKPSCMRNICDIGHALIMYSHNNGVFPDRLSVLVEQEYLSPESLFCPDEPGYEAKMKIYGEAFWRLKEDEKKKLLEILDDMTSYVYVPGLTEESPDYMPIVYDKPGNHEGYSNVWFVGGYGKPIPNFSPEEYIKKMEEIFK